MMKCVCGYEHKETWELENDGLGKEEAKKVNQSMPEFIEVEGTFLRSPDNGWNKTQAFLYACPKCMTVRMAY